MNPRASDRPSIFIAGATGYLGRHLCAEYQSRGWHVSALVRDIERAGDLAADRLVEAQATRPETLAGVIDGADAVVSSIGITRQTDGLTYQDVDFQANVNLLVEAERAGVERFGYVHVLNADEMQQVPLVAAKAAFVRRLRESRIPSTVVAPTGYFSDMADFLAMARRGRVWLFGDGQRRINPIHGADLAAGIADAMIEGRRQVDIGGPDVLSHEQVAQLAFASLGRPARITTIPDALRRLTLRILPYTTPRRVHGPGTFFLTAMGLDMVGELHGTHRLADFYAETTGTPPVH